MEKVVCIVCPNSLRSKLDVENISRKIVGSNIQHPFVFSVEGLSDEEDPYKKIRQQYEQLILTWGCPFFKDGTSTLKKIGVIAATPAPFIDKNVLKRGTRIYVANGRIASSVAEHAVYLALDGLRDGAIGQMNGFKNNFSHFSLNSRNIGIIGMGATGRKVAKLCSAFNSIISYYDPYVDSLDHIRRANTLLDLIVQSEVLFVCTSHTKHTESLLCNQILCKLRKNSIVVNVARGAIMPDEEVLKTANKRPDIRFRIDVIEKESYENPLFKTPSVRITSHVGGPVPDDFVHLLNDVYNGMSGQALDDSYVTTISTIEHFDRFSIK